MTRERGSRVERDVIGDLKVPKDAYYGIFSERAAKNFPISGLRIHEEMNRAIVLIKREAAMANVKLRLLNKKVGHAIIRACNKILKESEEFEDQFVLDVFQAGAGTPWHMNVNEVVANVALEMIGKKRGDYKVIDPHNHVNMAQSTNDVIPTAIRLACLKLCFELIVEIKRLIFDLKRKGVGFKGLIKSGRTHLQDAVPISLGQEFNAWASTLEKRLHVLQEAMDYLRVLHIGGTAVGTGFNAHPKFAGMVVAGLKKSTKFNLVSAKNKIEETQFMSDFLDLSASLRTLAIDLGKICNDIRLLSSGPVNGLNELKVPEVEAGSSIMPGKVNPSMAEMLNMVCYQVIGNDVVVRECAASGQLELNVMTPVMSHNLLQSLDILRNGIREFNDRCLKGIKANADVLRVYAERNPSVATVLNMVIGYDKTAEVVKEALRSGKSVKEIVVSRRLVSEKEAERLFSRKRRGV